MPSLAPRSFFQPVRATLLASAVRSGAGMDISAATFAQVPPRTQRFEGPTQCQGSWVRAASRRDM